MFIQLTLEQHRFELCGSADTQDFFTKSVLRYYVIQGWLNSRMRSCGYGGHTVKLDTDFPLFRGSEPPTPSSRVNCILCLTSLKYKFHNFSLLYLEPRTTVSGTW